MFEASPQIHLDTGGKKKLSLPIGPVAASRVQLFVPTPTQSFFGVPCVTFLDADDSWQAVCDFPSMFEIFTKTDGFTKFLVRTVAVLEMSSWKNPDP